MTAIQPRVGTEDAVTGRLGRDVPRPPRPGGSHGYSYVRKSFTNDANSVDQGIASCSRHQVPVGGGGLSGANNTTGAQALNSSYPHDDGDRGNAPDGWAIFIDNTTAQNQEAQVFAICKRVR